MNNFNNTKREDKEHYDLFKTEFSNLSDSELVVMAIKFLNQEQEDITTLHMRSKAELIRINVTTPKQRRLLKVDFIKEIKRSMEAYVKHLQSTIRYIESK